MWFAIYKGDEIVQIGYIIEQEENEVLCSLFDPNNSSNSGENKLVDLSQFTKDGFSVETSNDPVRFFQSLCQNPYKITVEKLDPDKSWMLDGLFGGHGEFCYGEEAEQLQAHLKELEKKRKEENDRSEPLPSTNELPVMDQKPDVKSSDKGFRNRSGVSYFFRRVFMGGR